MILSCNSLLTGNNLIKFNELKIIESVKILAVIILTGIFLFLLTEISMRIYTHYFTFYDVEMVRYALQLKEAHSNPLIGHVHRPNKSAKLMNVMVEINSDGLRDDEIPIPRGDKNRIIILGDSLTFAWGVEKTNSFEHLLEARFNELAPTEIINFGTGNYNTEQEVNLFIEKGLKYEPDKVVIFYFINDAEPTPHKSKMEFLGHSRAVTFFWSRIKAVVSRVISSKSFHEYYSTLYRDDQPGWVRVKSSFLKIKEICHDERIDLQVVILPELHDLKIYPFKEEHEKLTTFLQQNGIPSFDLAQCFGSETNPIRLWVARDDAHPNRLAHKIIAESSFEFIAQELNNGTKTENKIPLE